MVLYKSNKTYIVVQDKRESTYMITVNGFKPKIENFGNGESNLTLPFLNELEDPIANFKVVWSYKNDLEIWSIKQIESILEHYLEKNSLAFDHIVMISDALSHIKGDNK